MSSTSRRRVRPDSCARRSPRPAQRCGSRRGTSIFRRSNAQRLPDGSVLRSATRGTTSGPTSKTWPGKRGHGTELRGDARGDEAVPAVPWGGRAGPLAPQRRVASWIACCVAYQRGIRKIVAMRAHCTSLCAGLLRDRTHLGAPLVDEDEPIAPTRPTVCEDAKNLAQSSGVGGDVEGGPVADESMRVGEVKTSAAKGKAATHPPGTASVGAPPTPKATGAKGKAAGPELRSPPLPLPISTAPRTRWKKRRPGRRSPG